MVMRMGAFMFLSYVHVVQENLKSAALRPTRDTEASFDSPVEWPVVDQIAQRGLNMPEIRYRPPDRRARNYRVSPNLFNLQNLRTELLFLEQDRIIIVLIF
jgi:hypothetical protein